GGGVGGEGWGGGWGGDVGGIVGRGRGLGRDLGWGRGLGGFGALTAFCWVLGMRSVRAGGAGRGSISCRHGRRVRGGCGFSCWCGGYLMPLIITPRTK